MANIRGGLFSDGTNSPGLGFNTGTVLDDGAVDALTGSTGSDWFFAGTGDVKKDTAEVLN